MRLLNLLAIVLVFIIYLFTHGPLYGISWDILLILSAPIFFIIAYSGFRKATGRDVLKNIAAHKSVNKEFNTPVIDFVYRVYEREGIEQMKENLKRGLSKCTFEQQDLFKRLYSNIGLGASINDVVDQMDEGAIEGAVRRVKKTLLKNNTEL